jgi:hypothetical protein
MKQAVGLHWEIGSVSGQTPSWAYCGDYRFLGLLSALVEHVSDLTRLYIRKCGVPPANTRNFIRTWQHMEGWECRGQMRLTDALVPARVWVVHSQRASRTDGKKGGEQEENKRRIRA